MKFDFIGYTVEGTPAQPGIGVVFRPVVPVRVAGSLATANFYGLVDTGADETILTRAQADAIGAEMILNATSRIYSAGGEVPLTYARVELGLTHAQERHRWPAIVGVADQDWSEALLGFRGFLEYFDATFSGLALTLDLVRNARPLPA